MEAGRLRFISDGDTKIIRKKKFSFPSLREVGQILQESSHSAMSNQRWELAKKKENEKLF